MANLVPSSSWDDVYRLEETDPVQGGIGGVSNLPNQRLLNRTERIKKTLSDLSIDVVNDNFDDVASVLATKTYVQGEINTLQSNLEGQINNLDTFDIDLTKTIGGGNTEVYDTNGEIVQRYFLDIPDGKKLVLKYVSWLFLGVSSIFLTIEFSRDASFLYTTTSAPEKALEPNLDIYSNNTGVLRDVSITVRYFTDAGTSSLSTGDMHLIKLSIEDI